MTKPDKMAAAGYPGYDVLDKWASPSFDPKTRGVVARRLHVIPERCFFTEDEWGLVEAITARLIPQPERAVPIPLTPWIDQMLAEGKGDGFRFDGAPVMQEAWRRGLAGIQAEAQRRFARNFAALDPDSQDATLRAVQRGESIRRLGRARTQALLLRRPAEGGGRRLLCAPRRLERDRLRRPGQPARLCAARLRRARSLGGEGGQR